MFIINCIWHLKHLFYFFCYPCPEEKSMNSWHGQMKINGNNQIGFYNKMPNPDYNH